MDFPFDKKNSERYLSQCGVRDLLKQGRQEEITACLADLAVLHYIVRTKKPFQILEFGSGFSTIVMAFACRQNWDDYIKACGNKPAHGTPNVISVETAEEWRQNTETKIESANLTAYAKVVTSKVSIGEHRGQVCHFYDNLPDVVPDFVYLDGPDPAAVEGDVNGISFKNKRRTVMSGDVLKYESTLVPGFSMIVDGRANNVRFLERNLQRKYKVTPMPEFDQTLLELEEERLGRKNVFGFEAYKCPG